MLQLISVHIPKTAGSTFRTLLGRVYGARLALDYDGKVDGLDSAEVVHGHFPATKYLKQFPDAKIITWLRHPVERVISYYYYWLRVERHGNPNHDYFLDNKLSLLEFARFPSLRNEIMSYFQGVDPERFFFVGIVERYESDVRKLAALLDWPEIPAVRENVTLDKPDVSLELREEIARLHGEEMALYRRFSEDA